MSARFHRFADFAPDDVEWWQGEAGLLESYVGEWLPPVVDNVSKWQHWLPNQQFPSNHIAIMSVFRYLAPHLPGTWH